MMTGLRKVIAQHGLQIRVQGGTGVFYTIFGADPDKEIFEDADLATADLMQANAFYQELMKAGVVIVLEGRWFVSAAITDDDIDQTLAIVDGVLKKLYA